MIRANNAEIDIDVLREKIRTTSDRLRASRAIEELRKNRVEGKLGTRQMLRMRYRAAEAYIERAMRFGYPETRLPRRLALVQRVAPWAGRLLLRVYNFVLYPAREANVATVEALRELTRAGLDTATRLAELEEKLSAIKKVP